MRIKQLIIIIFILTADLIYGQKELTLKPEEKSIIKYDFFSPFQGCLGFAVETSKKNLHAFEFEIGFIGIKLNERYINEKFLGAYSSAGVRFYFENYKEPFQNNYFLFNGIYIKPEVIINYFTYFDEARKGTYGENLSLAALICAGNQWYFMNKVVLDFWLGFGYDKNWITEEYNGEPSATINYYTYKYNYFHLLDGPMIFDWCLSIGILINK